MFIVANGALEIFFFLIREHTIVLGWCVPTIPALGRQKLSQEDPESHDHFRNIVGPCLKNQNNKKHVFSEENRTSRPFGLGTQTWVTFGYVIEVTLRTPGLSYHLILFQGLFTCCGSFLFANINNHLKLKPYLLTSALFPRSHLAFTFLLGQSSSVSSCSRLCNG